MFEYEGRGELTRRIQGWDDSGRPIGGMDISIKEQRIKTLSEHYGSIADSVADNELSTAKTEVEQEFLSQAKKGKRQFNWYPSTIAKKYKDQLTKWMQDDGVIVNWKHDQRDGDWVEVSY